MHFLEKFKHLLDRRFNLGSPGQEVEVKLHLNLNVLFGIGSFGIVDGKVDDIKHFWFKIAS